MGWRNRGVRAAALSRINIPLPDHLKPFVDEPQRHHGQASPARS